MNKFYKIAGAYKRSAIIVDCNLEYDEFDAFSDFTILSDKKIKFRVSKGKKSFDIIQFRYDGFNFLISEKLKKILEENDIGGWKSFPVNVEGLVENYYGFHITGKAGEILNKKERISIDPPPVEFHIDTWDSSDIFSLENTALKVCTERVKNILEQAEITNLEISDL